MKTIKTLLTIVIMIASTTFAKAQQDAKYHYHDLGSKGTISTGYITCSFPCSTCVSAAVSVTDAKYHYHDLAKATKAETAKQCASLADCIQNDNSLVLGGKYQYHSLAAVQTVKSGECADML
jgi:hypothetical protein